MSKSAAMAFLRRSNATSIAACFPVRHSRAHDPSPIRVDGTEIFRAEVPELIKFAEINLTERCFI
jgi:hypothetical protein